MTSFCFVKTWVFAGVEKSSRVAMLVSPNDISSPNTKVAPDRIFGEYKVDGRERETAEHAHTRQYIRTVVSSVANQSSKLRKYPS